MSADAKDLIERAARSVGLNASEFTTAAACNAARETLRRHEVTTLSPDDAAAFVAALDRTEPSGDLKKLMQLHAAISRT